MEQKLDELLQKSAFWIRTFGGVLSFFNLFFGGIFLLYTFYYGFGNDGLRALIGFVCLLGSSYIGMTALKTASKIKKYQDQRETNRLKEAFQIEAVFWNYLTFLVLGGVAFMVLIIFLGV